MSRMLDRLLLAVGLGATLILPAHASPKCLNDEEPFALGGDSVTWTMQAAPGSQCIQGLRWSYMQIYSVSVQKAPTKGRLFLVGPGFRYFADSGSDEGDSFTLVVVGKNRHDSGTSTIEVVVNRPAGTVVGELTQRP